MCSNNLWLKCWLVRVKLPKRLYMRLVNYFKLSKSIYIYIYNAHLWGFHIFLEPFWLGARTALRPGKQRRQVVSGRFGGFGSHGGSPSHHGFTYIFIIYVFYNIYIYSTIYIYIILSHGHPWLGWIGCGPPRLRKPDFNKWSGWPLINSFHFLEFSLW